MTNIKSQKKTIWKYTLLSENLIPYSFRIQVGGSRHRDILTYRLNQPSGCLGDNNRMYGLKNTNIFLKNTFIRHLRQFRFLLMLQVQCTLQVFVNDSVHQNLPVIKDHSVQAV